MAADNPAPDNDTMESLLDVNEQVQAALNAHQRAALSAKKSLGIEGGGAGTPTIEAPSPDFTAMGGANGSGRAEGSSSRSASRGRRDNGKGREDAPLPALPKESDKGKGAAASYEPPAGPPPGRANDDAEDPFRDPHDEGNHHHQQQQGGSSFLGNEALAFDSFHPGFQPAGAASGSRREQDDDIYDSGSRR